MALKMNIYVRLLYTNFGKEQNYQYRKNHLWRVWRNHCVDSHKRCKLQMRWS